MYIFQLLLVHFSVIRRSPVLILMLAWSWLLLLEFLLENQVSLSLVSLTLEIWKSGGQVKTGGRLD